MRYPDKKSFSDSKNINVRLSHILRNKTANIIVMCLILFVFAAAFISGCSKNSEQGTDTASVKEDSAEHGETEDTGLKEDTLWSDKDSMKAIIISDLHYTGLLNLLQYSIYN